MPDSRSRQVFRIDPRSGPAGRMVWRTETRDGARYLVIARYQGPELPATLTDPLVDEVVAASLQESGWRLRSAEGRFDFRARAVDWLEECPELYAPLHQRYRLRATDRLTVRILLWLLRLPGGARWLRHWHSQRR